MRGDSNLGASFYENGKSEYKLNSCLDVFWAIQWLVNNRLIRSGSIGFQGRSAGGLLAGCLTVFLSESRNIPDSFPLKGTFYPSIMKNAIQYMLQQGLTNGSSYVNVVIAEVPFIDAVTDMMDPSVPWVEYEWYIYSKNRYEWGNPWNITIYQAMLDYSPYDNINSDRFFPALLVTSGFFDTR